MTDTVIKFRARADDPALRLSVWIDSMAVLEDADVSNPKVIDIAVDDRIEGDHRLDIVLAGKTWAHTKIDDSGDIIQDCMLHLSDFTIDEINLDQLVWENARYRHDNNGTGDFQDHDFFGNMGCNGRVQLEFQTPVYLWLLEKM